MSATFQLQPGHVQILYAGTAWRLPLCKTRYFYRGDRNDGHSIRIKRTLQSMDRLVWFPCREDEKPLNVLLGGRIYRQSYDQISIRQRSFVSVKKTKQNSINRTAMDYF